MAIISVLTIIFDLDGTLVDSVPDLLASANRVMAARGLAPFTLDEVTPMVGDGAGVLVRRLLAARGQEARPKDMQDFVHDYMAHVADMTRPYPSVIDTLQVLQDAGYRMAVCTNKPEAPARAVLDALGLSRFFAAVAGGDTYTTRKPDPAHLLNTIRYAGGAPSRSIMVGDHHNDLAAATGAGIPSIFASWGYGTNTGATAVASAFRDIPAIADRLLSKAD
jgi:phosphoglycolate phosphatase